MVTRYWSNYKDIGLISVNLPNGNIVQAFCKGKVKICENLQIDDVLYLPDFAMNLISVSKLCKEQACIVTFETHQFIVQERKDLRRIGLLKRWMDFITWRLRRMRIKQPKFQVFLLLIVSLRMSFLLEFYGS